VHTTSTMRLERFFYVFVCAILLLAVVHWAQAVVLPVLMAVFLTFILSPVVRFLQRFGLPRVVAVLMAAILLFVVIGCFLSFFFYQLNGLANDLPSYKTRIVDKLVSIRESQLGAWVGNAAEFLTDFKLDPKNRGLPDAGPIPVTVQSSPLPMMQTVAGTTLHLLVEVALVFLLLIFMLMQREDLRDRIIRLGGRQHLARTTKVFDEASQRISRFLAAQFVVNVGVGVVMGFGLYLLAVPYALVWGALAAFSRYIPYLGAWLAAFFPLVATMAVMPHWGTFFLVLGLIATIELVTANVIEPIFFGHSIGVTGLALLIATVFWTWLWGPLGLFLATPLTAYLVVLGRHVPTLSFLPALMGEETPPHPHLNFFQRLLAKDPEEAAELLGERLKSQTVESVYDEILLPALNHALVEKDRGSMDDEDERFILASTRAVLQDLVWESTPVAGEADEMDAAPLLAGVSARDEANLLVLDMWSDRLAPGHVRIKLFSNQDADMLPRLVKESPTLVLFVAWSRVELAQARSFCKQARGRGLGKIVVLCWGDEEPDAVRQKLMAAGADAVGTTFAETQALVQSFLKSEERELAATT
jgi:predicted PurR-regulated permease PerM